MAVSSHARQRRLGRRPTAAVCLLSAASILLSLPGCGGCRRNSPPTKAQQQAERKKKEQEEKKKKKLKPKPNFEVARLMTCPFGGTRNAPPRWVGDGDPQEGIGQVGQPYKPGHWVSATLAAKANNFDFVGELEMAAVDRRGRTLPLPTAPFELITTREVSLAKGEKPKLLETVVYVPPNKQLARLSCRLNARGGGRRMFESARVLARMPSYQYHFVVLARRPELYNYLEKLDSIGPPSDDLSVLRVQPHYRLSLLKADRRIALPQHAALWTSTAYVLWDDADPEALAKDQQQAMLDWLHWGGQLILSGPDTLDTLADCFLTPYLPATSGGAEKLRAADFDELNAWVRRVDRRFGPDESWSGVKLKRHRQARFVPGSGRLLAERRVGRGRVVVSAFRLCDRDVVTWPGWDQVVNACLLGRPPRCYVWDDSVQDVRLLWADNPSGRLSPRELDAARTTKLRYFARDAGAVFGTYGADAQHEWQQRQAAESGSFAAPSLAEEASPPGPGVAAWNDFNPVAAAARETLLRAARIKIPGREFVVWVLAGYLLVLVPLNWAVFRLLGRVEWAWVAAPVIAVACTVLVIRLARLDIGFVRSRTEVALVEVQGGYDRAHVSRYTALYASLTTGYRLHFDDPGALVEPFASQQDPAAFRMPIGARRGQLVYRRGKSAALTGYRVGSNTTSLLHSEQMLELGGALTLDETAAGGLQLVNLTDLTLEGAGVLKRDERGTLLSAWVGTLEPGGMVPLKFRYPSPLTHRSAGDPFWQPERDASPLTVTVPEPGTLSLRDLIALAEQVDAERAGRTSIRDDDVIRLGNGDVRLVAFVQGGLPGLKIKRPAPQTVGAAVLVAHLQYGFGDPPRPDKRTRAEAEKVSSRGPRAPATSSLVMH